MRAVFVALPFTRLGDVAPILEGLRRLNRRARVITLDGRPCHTAEGLVIQADGAVEEPVPPDAYLCVVPSGLYEADSWGDLRLHRYLRRFSTTGGYFAASGEGLLCLASAGLLGGLRFTAPARLVKAHEPLFRYAIFEQSPVAIDGNVISSDGSDPKALFQAVFERLNIGS
ncbi:DJ-1/PfpI family protein [Alicyclobacillus mali]|uniref:DJ-1/PfpI family protein n=1 Tax=Alicyclobacillus mali (ex Roth et al. 2021) TaxID=1123961 RepID=A0ABS0F133_9BACL|nr:DJ-1/PfpI family protein [Alicyclobacillus mali (ex Roth et al. 2021)]MBF8376966.1 DJ-1/PfpI family protein [Alicyclobacillus mali (ex Roth et al. 2021)]MCL6489850.1 DJ-1/PfpI family protein [Alicyclobacillus mali (ex Roth et al. 2021)]